MKQKPIKLKKLIDIETQTLLESNSPQFADYVSFLKDSQIGDYWSLINNLETSSFGTIEEAKAFIQESINMAKAIDTKPVIKIAKRKDEPLYSELDLAINTVLFEQKTPRTLQNHMLAEAKVASHLVNNHKSQMMLEQADAIENPTLREYLLAEDENVFFEAKRAKAIQVLDAQLSETNDPQTKCLIYEAKEKIQCMSSTLESLVEIASLLED